VEDLGTWYPSSWEVAMSPHHQFITALALAGSLVSTFEVRYSPPVCTRLVGGVGSSDQAGSGWLDLASPTDFNAGDSLIVAIGGRAQKVVVRLLQGTDPALPNGVVGGIRLVPGDREIRFVLPANYKHVTQVSVHGNPRAWHWELGAENGPATMVSVDRCVRAAR
jgi:hypothetical protein